MKNPKVTVYITNYNYGDYIKKSILSVLQQTFKEFELIIIDDGSKDNSKKIINKFLITNPEIIYIAQKNRGLIISNNVALNLAKGKYIIRLDADDWLHKDALMKMVKFLDSNNKVGLVFPDYYEVNEEGLIIHKVQRHNFNKVKIYDQYAHGACTMIRTRLLKQIGGYDERFNCLDGLYLWLNFVKNYKVKNINEPLFYYRKHNKSLTTNHSLFHKTRSKILDKVNIIKKKTIAILPIRGKEINKYTIFSNSFLKKPLISYTIDTFLKNKNINCLIVSSPDDEVLNYIRKIYRKNKKIIYHKRKKSLGMFNESIKGTLKQCVKYALKKKIKFTFVYQLNYRGPFLNSDDIDSAFNLINFFNLKQVIGVQKEDKNYYIHKGKGLEKISNSEFLKLESNEIYSETGNLRVFHKKILLSNQKKLNTKDIGHILIDQKSGFYINSELDYKLAKIIYRS